MKGRIFFVETLAEDQRRDLCRWVERLFEEGYRVFVLTGSTISAQQLDKLLWSFSKASFVPHRIVTQAEEAIKAIEPVLIGWDLSARGSCNVLVCDETPDLEAAASFDTIVHFVPMDDADKREASRRLWANAKERTWTLRHVPLPSSARTDESNKQRSSPP
ncbi:MAG: DNA polymerase III subunit chi [Desulfosoma sp.]